MKLINKKMEESFLIETYSNFLQKKNKMKDPDLKELVKVYKHFRPQISKLATLQEI